MYITHKKGQIAVCEIQRRALDNDAIVSIPTTEERYDLIIDYEKTLYRTQVKYVDHSSPNANGSIIVDMRSKCRNNKNVKVYNETEIDMVLAYLPQLNKVVWIPPKIFHNKGSVSIRFAKSKSNRVKKMHFIEDFKIW